jgi:hypothetical protein
MGNFIQWIDEVRKELFQNYNLTQAEIKRLTSHANPMLADLYDLGNDPETAAELLEASL